jgi:hypothetical protein
MRYWSIGYPDEDGNDVVETLSEDEVLEQYWAHWYGKMCQKFGKEHVDTNYTKQDCIDDWVIVHWAWESTP